MLRYWYTALFILFLSGFVCAQKPFKFSYNCSSDTCLVNRLVDDYRSITHVNIDSALQIMLEAIELSKANNYDFGIINSYRLVADAYSLKFNLDTSSLYLDSAEKLAIETKDQIALSNILNLRGNIASDTANFSGALLSYNKALDLSKSNNYMLGVSKAYANIGVSHHLSGNTSLAITNYKMALPGLKQLKDSIGISIIISNISALYQKIDDFHMSNEYCYKALSYLDKSDLWGRASIYTNLGVNAIELKEFDKAYEYYESALRMGLKINDFKIISNCYNNLGDLRINQGEIEKGLDYLFKALEIVEDNKMTYDIAHINYVIGHAYFLKGDFDKAIEYAEISMAISENNNQFETASFAKKVLAESHFNMKEFKISASYYKEFSKIADSLKSEEFMSLLSEMEAKYEVGKLEKEQIISREKAELNKLALEKTKSERNYLIIGGLLMLVISLLIAYFLIQYRKTNRLIKPRLIEI